MHRRMIKNKFSYEKHAPQARFLINQIAPQARLIKQNAPKARFSDLALMGTLSCKCSM